MSDEELDREWQPNGRRPQSTIARSFSQELMDIFRIENSISDLDSQVDQRKQTVGKNNQELASLEQRLKEMEERLRRSQPASGLQSIPQRSDDASTATATATTGSDNAQAAPPKDEKARSRPGTARATQQAPSSGNMPPTPGASEGEYYLVTRADLVDESR